MRKSKKIVIILIIIIFILLCGIFAFAYLGTDMFKSNKYLFNKYAAQMDLNEFLDFNAYEEFSKRILNELHTNEGYLLINAQIEEFGNVDEEIRFKTNANLQENKYNGEIVFKQEGEEKLGLEYLKNDDLYGLKCIYRQYMVLENKNLKQFASKLGLNENKILDRIDFNIQETKPDEKAEQLANDIKNIFNKYAKLAINEIPDKNYEKIKKEKIEVEGQTIEADGCKITLTGNEIIEIYKRLLNIAKDDQDILDLINTSLLDMSKQEPYDLTDYQSIIEKLDNSLSTENIDDNIKLTIFVYKQGKKLVKTYIQIIDAEENNYIDLGIENNRTLKLNYEINLNKTYSYFEDNSDTIINKKGVNLIIVKDTTNDENKYNITYVKTSDDDTRKINLSFSLKNTGEESYQTSLSANLDLSSKYDYKIDIDYNNITTFSDDIQIPEFEEGNYVILNDLSEEQLSRLTQNLGEKINEKVDIEKIYVPYISESITLSNSLFENAKRASEETKEAQFKEAIALAKAEIISNYYSGNTEEPTEEEVKAVVKSYVYPDNTVEVRKEIGENKFIVNIDGTDYTLDLTTLEQYQENVMQNLNSEMDNQVVRLFNAKFESYIGQESGSTAKQLLTIIGENNSTNREHMVETNCTIADIDSSKKYNISFEKDDEGYINKILIDEL